VKPATPPVVVAQPPPAIPPVVPPVTPPVTPPVVQPPAEHVPSPSVLIHDTTINADVPDTFSQPYAGPVPYLKTQMIDTTPHSLNIAVAVPDIFIHTGSGNDAVALLGGQNVVDGGTGSNFLTSGSGTDTFFVDARAIAADVWSTVVGLHSGDAATLFGISPGTQALTWLDNDGAVGAKGLTLHATADGKPTASLTLAGLTMADMASGKITTSFGSNADSGSYLYVHAA
jgi:Ca2+-binding RTX toxin-like protein